MGRRRGFFAAVAAANRETERRHRERDSARALRDHERMVLQAERNRKLAIKEATEAHHERRAHEVDDLMLREFAPAPRRALPPLDRPAFVAAWKDALSVGIEIGNHSAPIKVVEFADLECPFCRRFHETMVRVIEKHPHDVSLVFVHFPLPGHRFARQAARAVKCADARGRFNAMVGLLYSQQDSIGMKSWGAFAHDVGIPDTAGFRSCALDPSTIKLIDEGKAFGEKIQVTATPTVLVNGWRYGRAPDENELERIVRTMLKGGSPVDTVSKENH